MGGIRTSLCWCAVALATLCPAALASHTAPGTNWCGTDTTANLPDQTDAPRVKFVYAHAADMPNRLTDFNSADSTTNATRLQNGVSALDDVYLAASEGTRVPRWDFASTSACPKFVDIERVSLPRAAADYRSAAGIELLKGDVRAAVDPAKGRRNIFVFADQLRKTGTALTIFGVAEYDGDDRKGLVNSTQRGGKMILAFSSEGAGIGSGVVSGTGLHELTHAFGAVAASAPHATPDAHCTDGRDVMCLPGEGYSEPCAGAVQLDCNSDDYFSVSPPAGSYLATHHNVYDSVFLAPPAALTTPAAAPTASLSYVAPSSAGHPTTMDASASSDADGLIRSYEWDTDGNGTFDRTTTSPTTTTTAAKGTTLRVRVTDEDGIVSAIAERAVDVERSSTDPPPDAPPPAQDLVKPSITAASLTRTRIRRGQPAFLRVGLSERAAVSIRLSRLLLGRKVGAKCVRHRRRLRQKPICKRHRPLGVLRRARGVEHAKVRLATQGLERGPYELVIRATDAAGNRSKPRRVKLRIV